MTITGSGSLSLNTNIVGEYPANTGKNMGSMRGVTWYLDNVLTTSTFSSTNLKFSDFYNKRRTDPAGASSTTVNTVGNGSFTVPLFRNNITFYSWGGGGGSNGSGDGGSTTISLPSVTLSANGGYSGGGGGRRYVGPAGAGGSASGDASTFTESGAGGGGAAGKGGNAGGVSDGGGDNSTQTTGGNFTYFPGNSPGAGGSGFFGYDGSKDPGYSGGGGAGGSGFAKRTFTSAQLTTGTAVPYTVAPGGGNGGGGQVKIVWT